MISAKDLTSTRGSQPDLFAQSSQKGLPVSGEKCQSTISRTCASSVGRAVSTACGDTESADMVQWRGRVGGYAVTATGAVRWSVAGKYFSIVARVGGLVRNDPKIMNKAEPNTMGTTVIKPFQKLTSPRGLRKNTLIPSLP